MNETWLGKFNQNQRHFWAQVVPLFISCIVCIVSILCGFDDFSRNLSKLTEFKRRGAKFRYVENTIRKPWPLISNVGGKSAFARGLLAIYIPSLSKWNWSWFAYMSNMTNEQRRFECTHAFTTRARPKCKFMKISAIIKAHMKSPKNRQNGIICSKYANDSTSNRIKTSTRLQIQKRRANLDIWSRRIASLCM